MHTLPEPNAQAPRAAGFMAWHYTTANAFLRIVKAHVIAPSSVSPGTKGVVWFSVNDDLEPSAFRHAIEMGELDEPDHGAASQATDPQAIDRGVGMVRLGVPVRTLLTCAELKKRAAIDESQWRDICDRARDSGGDPDEWFGCLRAVPLRECLVEVRMEDGRWRRMQGGVAAALPRSRGLDSRSHHLVGR